MDKGSYVNKDELDFIRELMRLLPTIDNENSVINGNINLYDVNGEDLGVVSFDFGSDPQYYPAGKEDE